MTEVESRRREAERVAEWRRRLAWFNGLSAEQRARAHAALRRSMPLLAAKAPTHPGYVAEILVRAEELAQRGEL